MNMVKRIGNNSVLTSVQQSVMNFGILMIQGLVNSFGVSVMAAFAAVVKIESFAYLPEQEFGNAFSTFRCLSRKMSVNSQNNLCVALGINSR
jgi:Na+-driven multidrug efflux pump